MPLGGRVRESVRPTANSPGTVWRLESPFHLVNLYSEYSTRLAPVHLHIGLPRPRTTSPGAPGASSHPGRWSAHSGQRTSATYMASGLSRTRRARILHKVSRHGSVALERTRPRDRPQTHLRAAAVAGSSRTIQTRVPERLAPDREAHGLTRARRETPLSDGSRPATPCGDAQAAARAWTAVVDALVELRGASRAHMVLDDRPRPSAPTLHARGPACAPATVHLWVACTCTRQFCTSGGGRRVRGSGHVVARAAGAAEGRCRGRVWWGGSALRAPGGRTRCGRAESCGIAVTRTGWVGARWCGLAARAAAARTSGRRSVPTGSDPARERPSSGPVRSRSSRGDDRRKRTVARLNRG